jgi:hypothetical protein
VATHHEDKRHGGHNSRRCSDRSQNDDAKLGQLFSQHKDGAMDSGADRDARNTKRESDGPAIL